MLNSLSKIFIVYSGRVGERGVLRHCISLLFSMYFSVMKGLGFSVNIYSTFNNQLDKSTVYLFLSKLSNRFVNCLLNCYDI